MSSVNFSLDTNSICEYAFSDIKLYFHYQLVQLHAARTAWDGLLANVFIAISSKPTDLEVWNKVLMLSKCILVSPSQRGCCLLWITSKIVKDRIRPWNAGDFVALWSDVITEEVRLCSHGRRKASSASQCIDNVHRA